MKTMAALFMSIFCCISVPKVSMAGEPKEMPGNLDAKSAMEMIAARNRSDTANLRVF